MTGATAGAVLLTLGLAIAVPGARAEEAPPPVAASPAEPVPPATSPFPLRRGDTGAYVEVVHKRLAWLGYDIDQRERRATLLGPSTQRALRAFGAKFGGPSSTGVSATTWRRLKARAGAVGTLPASCRTGTVICIDTATRLLRFVDDGTVRMTADARFGMPTSPTRRGTFRVHLRSRDHVSSLYETSMPYALFFSGGQAVHYSAYFQRDGYAGASHGCVNLRDRAKAAWLFDHAPLGTRVHIA